MNLTQALATSLSGLTATQTNLSIVAGNVANAQTPGYIAQSAVQVATASGDSGDGVRIASINRLLDQFVQKQLRSESSGGAYADLKASFYQQLQQIYGQPGSGTSLDSAFNNFTTAVQALSTIAEFVGGAKPDDRCSAGLGAAAQQCDRRHPNAAQPGRPGHRGRCSAGQQRPAADREYQSAAGWQRPRPTARRLCWKTSAINTSTSWLS